MCQKRKTFEIQDVENPRKIPKYNVENHARIKIESSPMFIKILKYSDV